jgi:tRNA pseudouridine38-40 synthase
MNVKLILEYEGTRYHGWQAQRGTATIESALRDAIESLTGESPVLTAAGRTDAGVHALGQVVNFKLERAFPVEQLPGALNARLASDISVRHAELVDETFNARYSHSPGVASWCLPASVRMGRAADTGSGRDAGRRRTPRGHA